MGNIKQNIQVDESYLEKYFEVLRQNGFEVEKKQENEFYSALTNKFQGWYPFRVVGNKINGIETILLCNLFPLKEVNTKEDILELYEILNEINISLYTGKCILVDTSQSNYYPDSNYALSISFYSHDLYTFKLNLQDAKSLVSENLKLHKTRILKYLSHMLSD